MTVGYCLGQFQQLSIQLNADSFSFRQHSAENHTGSTGTTAEIQEPASTEAALGNKGKDTGSQRPFEIGGILSSSNPIAQPGKSTQPQKAGDQFVRVASFTDFPTDEHLCIARKKLQPPAPVGKVCNTRVSIFMLNNIGHSPCPQYSSQSALPHTRVS